MDLGPDSDITYSDSVADVAKLESKIEPPFSNAVSEEGNKNGTRFLHVAESPQMGQSKLIVVKTNLSASAVQWCSGHMYTSRGVPSTPRNGNPDLGKICRGTGAPLRQWQANTLAIVVLPGGVKQNSLARIIARD